MALHPLHLPRPPFDAAPDAAFYYEDAARRELLGALQYALRHGDGIIKVAGEAGSGKSMLCAALEARYAQQAAPDTRVVRLTASALDPQYAMHAIARQLGLAPDGMRSDEVMRMLDRHLTGLRQAGKLAVLLIEEAQALPLETMEQLRLLTNLDAGAHKLLPIALIGSPELNTVLKHARLRQLRERITLSFVLEPFAPELVPELLEFRLRAAGCDSAVQFQLEAARLIARTAGGDLRQLMALAAKSLAAAASAGEQAVAAVHVRAAIKGAPLNAAAPATGTETAADKTLPLQANKPPAPSAMTALTAPEPVPVPAQEPAPMSAPVPVTVPVPAPAPVPVPVPVSLSLSVPAPELAQLPQLPALAQHLNEPEPPPQPVLEPEGEQEFAPPLGHVGTQAPWQQVPMYSAPVHRPKHSRSLLISAAAIATAGACAGAAAFLLWPAPAQTGPQPVRHAIAQAPSAKPAPPVRMALPPASDARPAPGQANTPAEAAPAPAAVASMPPASPLPAKGLTLDVPSRPPGLLKQSLLATKTWLRDEPENNYCVQIENFPAAEEARAEQFLAETRAAIGLSEVHSYPMLIKGEPRIAIVYGSYASAKKVQEVQAKLADRWDTRPKIRTIKGIRQAVAQASLQGADISR